ncbi:NB-ARC domain-containing protein [Saccharopolyspora sp. 5N708]
MLLVDREDEIGAFTADAQAAIASGAPLLRVFTGPEGVGKTTLGVQACYEVADQYPDAHLYYDLRGSDAEASAEEVAGSFLRQLGYTGDEIPERADDRFAELRSRLAGRKVLMLLDDVARADQVERLLFDSPTAAVVITTRRPLTALRRRGFTPVEVRPFRDEHAKQLITLIAGERLGEIEPDVLRGVREVCEGLPLALSIAAANLSEPDAPADYLVALLRTKPHEALELEGDRPVLRVFETTYQELEPDEARAYELLSLLPGPHFGTGVAAEVLGVSEADAVRLLREMARRYVLERHGEGRYRFHSLVRAHAQDRARATFSPMEIASTAHRARWWYCRRQVALDKTLSHRPIPLGAQQHYQAIDPAYASADERRAWAEAEVEWPNMIAAMAADGDHPQDELTAVFPLALWSFGYQTRQCTELIDAYQRALERGPEAGEAWQLHRDLAGLHERCGEPDAADRYVALALQTGYEPGFASVYEWHGLAREARGDRAGALESLRQSADAVPLMGDPVHEQRARALLAMHVGRNSGALGEHEQAAAALHVAHEYFAERDEPINLARTGLDLGRELAGLDRRGEAIALLESAFATFRERSMRDKAIEAAEELARIADIEGRPDDAKAWRAVADELRG